MFSSRNFRKAIILVVTFSVLFSLFIFILQKQNEQAALELQQDFKIADELEQARGAVDKYCRNLDERFYAELNPDSESILSRAKRAKLVRDTLIFFPALGQMWCLVPKAASTSWSRILMTKLGTNDSLQNSFANDSTNTNGTDTTKPLQVIFKEKFGHVNKMDYIDAVRNDEIKKVLLVRHPFARIASAYRDKLQNRKVHSDGQYFYQHYGALIIRQYRKNRRLKQLEPTFPEFIDFLLDRDPIEYDEHWQPISILCGLCHVRYHFVIKTESLQKNTPGLAKYLMNALGFRSQLIIPWENRGDPRSTVNDLWISEYYRNISRSKMVLLYKKYEMDFHVFNYSFLQYYFQ